MLILRNLFYPVAPFYYGDDWFVLPERLWFPNNFSWLGHLLFFNQTRFTAVGDYMLYRPGVFTWIWLQDIFFRSDRVGLQVLVMTATIATVGTLYFWLYRHTGKLLAAAAALYALPYSQGNLLFGWPHISGYMFAMGFYLWAVTLWQQNPRTLPRAVAVAMLFFLAQLFHEFVAVTLVLLILCEFLFWRRIDRSASNWRLAVVSAASAAYLSLVITVWSVTQPPSFFSPNETNNVNFDLDYFETVLAQLSKIFKTMLLETLPFAALDPSNDWWRLAVAIIASVALSSVVVRRMRGQRQILALTTIPVVAIVLGLTMSRVAMRGGVGFYYQQMFHFFLAGAVALIAAAALAKQNPKRRQWLGRMLAGLLIISAIHTSYQTYAINLEREPTSQFLMKSVSEMRAAIEQHPERCYGGFFSPQFPGFMNQNLNISLQLLSCGWRPGRPLYMMPFIDRPALEINLNIRPNLESNPDVSAGLKPVPQSDELAPYLKAAPYNFREAGQALSHSGLIRARQFPQALRLSQVEVRWQSTEQAPQLNNVGLMIKSAARTQYFILQDNNLGVIAKEGSTPAQLTSQTQIAQIKNTFNLRILDLENHCLVFLDDFLLTATDRCFADDVQVGTFEYDNGTPAEQLVSLKILGAN